MIETNRDGLEAVLADVSTECLRFIYFYTPLCGTCRLTQTMLNVVETMLPDIVLNSCNINLMPDIAQALQIESVPCLLAVRQGRILEKVYAVRDVTFLYDWMNSYRNT